jgi:hypothetical protein
MRYILLTTLFFIFGCNESTTESTPNLTICVERNDFYIQNDGTYSGCEVEDDDDCFQRCYTDIPEGTCSMTHGDKMFYSGDEYQSCEEYFDNNSIYVTYISWGETLTKWVPNHLTSSDGDCSKYISSMYCEATPNNFCCDEDKMYEGDGEISGDWKYSCVNC